MEMIRKSLLFLAFVALSSAVMADDTGGHNVDLDRSKENMEQAEKQDPGLVHFLDLSKKAKDIKVYSGVFYDFKFITNTPDVFIKFVEKSKDAAAPRECMLLTQFQKSPVALDSAYRAKISTFSAEMKNVNYMAESDSSEENNALRFNYIDKNKKIHLSYWLDRENGFIVQRAVFDENEKLLAFSGYRGLRFHDEDVDFNKICASKEKKEFPKTLRTDLRALKNFELIDIETFCSGHDFHEFR
jgi:hypothetical protein